jgi:predicted DNA-binding transcriptional regulator AlpA
MEQIFLSLTKSDFQDLIAETFNSCLKRNTAIHTPPTESDRWFDLPELCDYLPDKPAKATVYGYVSANTIPCHKGAKKLRFLKSEIDTWLKQGRKKTVAEIEQETDQYLSKKKGGRNA